MRRFLPRAGIWLATGALLSVVACESAERHATPGALPADRLDVTPRLNASTYVAHGHLLEEQGNLESALAQYRQALRLAPHLTAARNRLGITLNKLGRHAEASAEFRQAVAQRPDAAYLHNNLGFSLYLEGHYAEAEPVLAQAIALQPSFRRAHMNHGLVLARLGRYEEALAAFSLAGSEADAYFNLALMQVEDGRYVDAARSLERALQLNPDFVVARQQLREIARLAADEEQARAAALAAATEARAAAPVETAAEADAAAVRVTASIELAPAIRIAVPPDSTTGERPPECAHIVAQIEELLVAAQSDPAQVGVPDTDAGELVALLDRLVEAAVTDAPWYEETLCQLRDVLGLPE